MGVADRIKPGVDEGSGIVLSGGSFWFTWVGNLDISVPIEGDPHGNSEGTRVGNKLVISYGEVLGIMLRVLDIIKIGCD